MENIGVKTIIYTDISRDGGLKGTNIPAYEKLKKLKVDIVASGGISFYDEIIQLKDMVYGAILGKAIYSDTLDLKKCIEISGE